MDEEDARLGCCQELKVIQVGGDDRQRRIVGQRRRGHRRALLQPYALHLSERCQFSKHSEVDIPEPCPYERVELLPPSFS